MNSKKTERINILPLPLGLNCVAVATRKAGHEVKLVDLMTEKDDQSSIRETIASFDPEIIGVSVRNVDDQNMEKHRFPRERFLSTRPLRNFRFSIPRFTAKFPLTYELPLSYNPTLEKEIPINSIQSIPHFIFT